VAAVDKNVYDQIGRDSGSPPWLRAAKHWHSSTTDTLIANRSKIPALSTKKEDVPVSHPPVTQAPRPDIAVIHSPEIIIDL
jgi:hypothetical protein